MVIGIIIIYKYIIHYYILIIIPANIKHYYAGCIYTYIYRIYYDKIYLILSVYINVIFIIIECYYLCKQIKKL